MKQDISLLHVRSSMTAMVSRERVSSPHQRPVVTSRAGPLTCSTAVFVMCTVLQLRR